MKRKAATIFFLASRFSLLSFLLLTAFSPLVVHGTCTPGNPPGVICPPDTGIKTPGDLKEKILCNILNWIFTVAIVLSVGFVLWAGINFLTSGGSEEKVTKARNGVLYAAVGVAIAILAKGVPIMISAFIGGGTAGFQSSDICP